MKGGEWTKEKKMHQHCKKKTNMFCFVSCSHFPLSDHLSQLLLPLLISNSLSSENLAIFHLDLQTIQNNKSVKSATTS